MHGICIISPHLKAIRAMAALLAGAQLVRYSAVLFKTSTSKL